MLTCAAIIIYIGMCQISSSIDSLAKAVNRLNEQQNKI